jgi:hypothetical protein
MREEVFIDDHSLSSKKDREKSLIRLVKDFFHPYELWGRQNRNQFVMGLIITGIYFLANFMFGEYHSSWNPFAHSSNGLFSAVLICVALIIGRIAFNLATNHTSKYPWYEKYMPMMITLLGLITLVAFQNLSSNVDDVSLWINLIVLLIIFIIAAGYFVEGSSSEKVMKIWFALFGYYFSVVAFFYFLENWFYKII